MAKMTAQAFVDKAVDIAQNYKTLYVMGCFGSPLTGANVSRYCNNHSYNKGADRTLMITEAGDQSPPVYGFDCVCLIKGILWGWSGDAKATYGGAKYASNGVVDVNADQTIKMCSDVTTDFSKIAVGEALWCPGHIGIYIGDGLAVESTPRWENKVQITAVQNIGKRDGYNARTWNKHGKLPWVSYAGAQASPQAINLAMGDVVMFTGTEHYVSCNSSTGKACKPGKAKVTGMSHTGKHPVHLVAITGAGSNVYGWVDAAFITRESTNLAVGMRVRITAGAKTYTGENLLPFVYTRTYDVLQVDGDRVVVGIGKMVTAAINDRDLTIV